MRTLKQKKPMPLGIGFYALVGVKGLKLFCFFITYY